MTATVASAMTIGQIAGRTGFSAKAIRYYERIKLLPPPSRTDAGYRLYRDPDLARLAFIRKAKQLGLTLDEMRDILSLRESGTAPCQHVLGLLDDHVERVEEAIAQLNEFHVALVRLRAAARRRGPANGGGVCRIIEHADLRRAPALAVEAPLRRRASRSARRAGPAAG